jgi:hypothetical protein
MGELTSLGNRTFARVRAISKSTGASMYLVLRLSQEGRRRGVDTRLESSRRAFAADPREEARLAVRRRQGN